MIQVVTEVVQNLKTQLFKHVRLQHLQPTSIITISHVIINQISTCKVQNEALIPLKENRLFYLGFKNSVVSTNLSRVNFKNLISHNPSSHEEYPLP